MLLIPWDELPAEMRVDEVRPYYDALRSRTAALVAKRGLDIALALLLMVPLLPIIAALAVAIKLESRGPVFFRQERVTQFGRRFRIFKLRSMVDNAERQGTQVTVSNDRRITRVGALMRRLRLDEICQLFDVLRGTMTFVGTRPEVVKYVDRYTPEMLATLLLPAGITSEASISYRDEDRLLDAADDPDEVYVRTILPAKMAYNLKELTECGLRHDLSVMLRTIRAVFLR